MAIYSKKTLREIPLFDNLLIEERVFIKPFIRQRKFNKGEKILVQGAVVNELLYIQSGRVTVSLVLPGGKEEILTHLGREQIIGEVAFFSNTQATATVICDEPCEGLILSHKVLNMLRIARPEIAFKIEQRINQLLVTKIITNINMIFDLYSKDKDFPKSCQIELIRKAKPRGRSLTLKDLDFNHIKKLNFFNELDETQISQLFLYIKIKEYEKKCIFHAENTDKDKIIVIYSGAILCFISKYELKKSIALFGIGDLFIQGFPYDKLSELIGFSTYEKTITLEIDFRQFAKIYKKDPAVYYIINKYINAMIANSVYILNREFIRINCEYNV